MRLTKHNYKESLLIQSVNDKKLCLSGLVVSDKILLFNYRMDLFEFRNVLNLEEQTKKHLPSIHH